VELLVVRAYVVAKEFDADLDDVIVVGRCRASVCPRRRWLDELRVWMAAKHGMGEWVPAGRAFDQRDRPVTRCHHERCRGSSGFGDSVIGGAGRRGRDARHCSTISSASTRRTSSFICESISPVVRW